MADQNQNHAYRALFEHSNIGIIISNESGIIEQVNPFAARMFGYENQELIGQKIENPDPAKNASTTRRIASTLQSRAARENHGNGNRSFGPQKR